MTLQLPKSMGECVYYTLRTMKDGKVRAWVKKEQCPKCGKGLMGKPRDPKTGKAKIRADHYLCPKCAHSVPKQEYEETLTAEVIYTCPHCQHEGEASIPFKRKKVQIFYEEEQKKKAVDVLRFPCGKCEKNIDITKKMK